MTLGHRRRRCRCRCRCPHPPIPLQVQQTVVVGRRVRLVWQQVPRRGAGVGRWDAAG